jgi:hypothetical protein
MILRQINSTKIYNCQSEIEMSISDFNLMTLYEIISSFIAGCVLSVLGAIMISFRKHIINLVLRLISKKEISLKDHFQNDTN